MLFKDKFEDKLKKKNIGLKAKNLIHAKLKNQDDDFDKVLFKYKVLCSKDVKYFELSYDDLI